MLARVPNSTSELVPDPETVPPVGADPVRVPLPDGTLSVTVITSKAPALASAILKPVKVTLTSSVPEKTGNVLTGGLLADMTMVATGALVDVEPSDNWTVTERSVEVGVGKMLL